MIVVVIYNCIYNKIKYIKITVQKIWHALCIFEFFNTFSDI